MKRLVTVKLQADVAIVTIDYPPVNALSHAVRSGLVEAVAQTESDPLVKAVVLHCNGRTFIAGADVKEFGQPPVKPLLPDVIKAIEGAGKPWIAAMHANALGGGLEVALACHYRIATHNTKLGLPEVNLGLIPGAGGTVRLPRLIAMENALSLITSGKPVAANAATQSGLIDLSIDDDLLSAAIVFAQEKSRLPTPTPLLSRPVVQPLDKSAAADSITTLKKKSRGQKSPVVAAEVIINGAQLSAEQALAEERAAFEKLRDGEQSKALRHLFFAERSASKVPETHGVAARKHDIIGVIGGGTMGAGIAASTLLSGRQVTLIEQSQQLLDKGLQSVQSILDESLKRRLIKPERHKKLLGKLMGCTNYSALSDADLVIEAVFENMSVKQAVFQALEKAARPDTVLATNTSYLDVNDIAKTLQDPSRVVGLHFFSPAHIMKLVEVIRTDSVAPDVLATAMSFAKSLGKTPVPAGVCDGFIGNRIMSAYRLACECMLEDGAQPCEIDSAMKSFGFPMGIFEMQDLAGLDIGWAARKRRAPTREATERYVDIPDLICEQGRYGRKTGSGYYLYSDGKTATPDKWVEDLIVSESNRKGIKRTSVSENKIMDTIILAMQSEGRNILAEGIAQSSDAIDVVMVLGYGFPRWRGGPMFLDQKH